MVGSQPTQDPEAALPMEQILQMFEELKGRLEATATQQSITDLAEKVDDLAEQVKRDKILWEADQHNLAILTENFNQFAGEVREDKGLVNGSLQRIQKDLDQNAETVRRLDEVSNTNLTGASTNEGSSKYIPPNERARANPKVGAQKTPQFALGAGTSKISPPRNSVVAFKGFNSSPRQGARTPDDPVKQNVQPFYNFLNKLFS
ncbi:hypothetical protein ACLB2K_060853 [Fragaria x ananassa]